MFNFGEDVLLFELEFFQINVVGKDCVEMYQIVVNMGVWLFCKVMLEELNILQVVDDVDVFLFVLK